MGQREEEAWKVAKTVNIVILWLINRVGRRREGGEGWGTGAGIGVLLWVT